MYRKFKKIASVVLAASMLLSGSVQGMAEEQPLAETAQTEAQTQAPTEAQTQAPTEAPQTEVPTEAPTEAQTQAPTEAQTEAQTQASTEAQTEAQTQAPTETQTEALTEGDTEAGETEKKTEKETETERSEHKNDGKKMSSSDLVSGLKGALPYLFAAEEVNGPEEVLKDQKIAEGSAGSSVVSGLEGFSVKLANARSSSDVEVINLYADKNGKLDTAQLDKVNKNHVIDVTKKYYVINVIADSEKQNLSFSGYDMTLSGQTVVYDDASQAGDILYNFAAMDGDGFTGYEGTVTLAGSGDIQGTYLAPEADVKVTADLAGAVYADSVQVADSVDELLKIVFVEGSDEAAETETTADEAAETETTAENTTESGTISEETEEIPVTVTEVESDTEQQTAELASEALELEAQAVGEELIDVASLMADAPSERLAAGAVFQAGLRTEDGTQITGGTLSVKAAGDIVEADGNKVYGKGAEIAGAVGADGNITLKNSGSYYLELTQAPTGYYSIPRIYFTIDDKGMPGFDTAANKGWTWDAAGRLLTVTLFAADSEPEGIPVLHVTDGNGTQINGASFVLYSVNGDTASVVDYISYTGAPVALTGLTAGSYRLSQTRTAQGYQIMPDNDPSMSFTVKDDTSVSVNVTNSPNPADGKTVTAAAQVYYNNVLLTAEENVGQRFYASLFSDAKLQTRVGEVLEMTYQKDAQASDPVTFAGLDGSRIYYLAATDEFGAPVAGAEYQTAKTEVRFSEGETSKAASVNYSYQSGSYPTGSFYYMAPVALTMNVQNYDGKALAVDETFYAELYSDAEHTQKITQEPIAFAMNNTASVTSTYTQVKMTAASGTIYLAETDQSGNALGSEYKYAVTYPVTNGAIAVNCAAQQGANVQETTTATIQNKLNSSVVKLRVIDKATGSHVAGATLVLKDSKGKVLNVNDTVTFASRETDIVLTNRLTKGQTYYLSEVSAASGYTPAPDVEFTVKSAATTEVELINAKTVSSNYGITVTKQVYSEKYPVYARDTTNGTYAAQGRYTFYAALFSDSARTKKVSNVQKITVSGFGGTTVFKNLSQNTTYYVAETNEYGEVISSDGNCSVRYANSGKVTASSTNQTTIIQNVYSSPPTGSGYRYTGTLTITKNMKNASGEAEKVTDTFYAGIYRKSDYSDTPTVIKLDLKDASSVSVKRRILLSGNNDMTYYIAEVDANGKRLNDSAEFGYSISIDQPSVTISRGDDKTVNITNQAKSSKVTLYITKRVYQGTALHAVNDTFYAGLFKDEKFTQLYTKPIPLNMNGKSELTLKLSLNLGNASNARIYIAEVDQNGKVIKDERGFGYEIKLVNSTAEFTQDRREHQAILLNSVYGTVSKDDWNKILSKDGNNLGSGEVISGNGVAAAAPQTADNTPIYWYLLLMAASLAVFVGCRRKRKC